MDITVIFEWSQKSIVTNFYCSFKPQFNTEPEI